MNEQIRTHLAESIASGVLSPGERLPSESELARQFGVSLAPLRTALGDLSDAGLIRRERGRGTYVCGVVTTVMVNPFESFSRGLRAAGVPFDIELVKLAVSEPTGHSADRVDELELGRCVRIARVATVNGSRSVFLESWVPVPRYARVGSKSAFERAGRSLHVAFEKNYGVSPVYGDRTLTVESADDSLTRLLDVAFGAPILAIDTVARTSDGDPIEFATSRYVAAQFSFKM